MQFIKELSKSKVVKVLTLALVLAGIISGVHFTQAASGSSLTVKVFEGGASNNKVIQGVNVRLNNGAEGTTDGSGIVVFNDLEMGVYNVSLNASGYYSRDYQVLVDMDTELDASMIAIEVTNPPSPPGPDGCTPLPPRGRPLLNIWPIATSGADCTDYPLLSVKNVSQGTDWMNGTSINANAGDTLRVELYVHNGTLDYPENEAQNVIVKSTISGNRITAEAWANNADRITSGQKGGDMTVSLGSSTLEYVSGSAILYDRNLANPRGLSDSVVTSGASIGNMRGCYPFLHLITFDLKVNAPPTPPPPPAPAKATLTVVKQVVGGTLSANDFELFVGDRQVINGQANTFDPGIYFVRENNKPNYTSSFTGECRYDGHINLASGDNKVCTITNTFQAPTPPPPPPTPTPGVIQIDKTVRNVTQNQNGFADQTNANPSDEVEFKLVVSSQVAVNNNVIVRDELPSRLTYSSGSLKIDGVANSSTLAGISLGNMAASTSKTLTFRARVASADAFTVGNTSLVNTGFVTSQTSNDSDTATVVVNKQQPTPGTLALTKHVRNVSQGQTIFASSSTANPGDQVEFQMTVTANGGVVNNVIFSDQLPSHLTYVNNSLTVDGVPSGNNLGVVSLGNFSNGTVKKVVIRAKVGASSEFPIGNTILTNTAHVTSSANSASASANVIVPISTTPVTHLTINKMARNVTQNQTGFADTVSAAPGDIVQFQIEVAASGNTTANNVVMTDNLPSRLSFISGSSTTNLGNITVGSSKTTILTVAVAGEGSFSCGSVTLTNTAGASASNAVSVSDDATVTVTRTTNCGGSNTNLTITKLARNTTQGQSLYAKSVSANPGDTIQFQIQVSASGNTAANNVVVTDSLPSNMNLVSGSTTINLGNISAGSTQTTTISAAVSGEGSFSCGSTTLTNTATATASNTGSVSDNASVIVTRNTNCGGGSSPFLSVTKEVRNVNSSTSFSSFASASTNDRVEFRIIVSNSNSGVTALNVRLFDSLPSGLTYVPGTFQVNYGENSGTLFSGGTWLGNIPSGSSRTVTFQASVNSSMNQTLTNTVNATSDNTNSATAQASVGVTASGNINLVLSKSAYNQTRNVDATSVAAQPGDVIVYTLRVQNQGNASALNFVFMDDLTDVLQHSNLKDFGNGSFNTGNLSLSWPSTTIPANSTIEKTFSVVVNNATPTNSDYVMTNIFGNTVNVRVARVSGVFVAPPTGPMGTLSFILAFATAIGFWTVRRGYAQSLIKFLTFQKNV